MSALCHSRPSAARQNPCSFDHFVGADEKRFRKGQSECLCSLEVYDQLEFGRQLNRQIGGVRTLENEIVLRAGTDPPYCFRTIPSLRSPRSSDRCKQQGGGIGP